MRLKAVRTKIFQEQLVPDGARLAGSAALVHDLDIASPVRWLSCVSEQHVRGSRRQEGAWTVFDKRYWPGEDFTDHLTFALRHEGIDLLILKRAFETVPQAVLESFVRATPTSVPVRRAWFLFEALTGRTLDAKDAPRGAAVDLLDPEAYFTGKPRLSRRHRVRDNLLGVGRFCPIIRRTKLFTEFITQDLAKKASEIIGRTSAHLAARAASFM